MDGYYGETYTVVGYALVDAQFINKRAGQRKVDIVTVFLNGYNGSKLLYDSGKHNSQFSILNSQLANAQKEKGAAR
jgi:hypothetical protein